MGAEDCDWLSLRMRPPRLHRARGEQLRRPLSQRLERLSVKVRGGTRGGHPAPAGLGWQALGEMPDWTPGGFAPAAGARGNPAAIGPHVCVLSRGLGAGEGECPRILGGATLIREQTKQPRKVVGKTTESLFVFSFCTEPHIFTLYRASQIL